MSLLELKIQLHWSPCFWNQLGQCVPKQLRSWGTQAASIYQWSQETLELQQLFSSPRTLEEMDPLHS